MILIALFLRHCPSFPLIKQHEFEALKAELPSQISQAKRSAQIPQSQRQNNEAEYTLMLPILEMLEHYELPKTNLSIIELILDDNFNQTQAMQQAISTIWRILFKNYIFVPEPMVNMSFIQEVSTLFLQPSQFAGLILGLLDFGCSIDSILELGIMQTFFKFNINSISSIHDAYQLIEKQVNSHEQVNDFLSAAASTSCDMPMFPHTNLLGQVNNQDQLNQVEIEERFLHDFTKEQFLYLFSWLGTDFLIICLNRQLEHDNQDIMHLLQDWFGQRNLDEIKSLYQTILTSLPVELRYRVFQLLGKYISEDVAQQLIESQSKWFWTLLATREQPPQGLLKKQLMSLASSQAIEVHDIDYVHDLCLKSAFKSLHHHFYKRIFELYLKNDDLELEFFTFHGLKHFEACANWVLSHTQSLMHNLLDAINDNIDHFNYDSFLNIRGVFLAQSTAFRKMCELNNMSDIYPENHYAFTSLVLSELYAQCGGHPNAIEWVQAMLIPSINPQEVSSSLKRILTEWMHHAPNPEIVLYAALVMHRDLGMPLSQLEILLSPPLSFVELARQSDTCLEYYLQLFPQLSLAAILTHSTQAHHKPLVYKLLSAPKTLLSFLKRLSSEESMKVLSFEIKNHPPVFVELFQYPKLLEHCLSTLSQEQKNVLFGFVHPKDEANVLYMAMNTPKSLKLLIDNQPYAAFIESLQQETLLMDNAFENAFNNPFSFGHILEALTTDDLLMLCQKHNKQSSKLHLESIVHNSQLLNLLLQHLPKDAVAKLFIDNVELLASNCCHKADVLHLILEHIDVAHQLELMRAGSIYHPFIHVVSHYPESLKATLRLIPKEERLNVIKIQNHKQQSFLSMLRKPIYLHLDLIIELLPQEQLLEFAAIPYQEQRTVLDILISDIHSFYRFYTSLPPKEQLALLNTVTFNEQRVIDQISLHELDVMVGMLSPHPEFNVSQMLMAHQGRLLQKAIHHYESLAYLLQFIDKIELLELLFDNDEKHSPQLAKLKNPASVVVLVSAALAIDHQSILMHKHQTYGNILQLCLHEPNQLIKIMQICAPNTQDYIAQKISNSTLNCKTLLEHPEALHAVLQYIPEPKRKSCLQAICSQNPNAQLTPTLKSVLTEYLFPTPKKQQFFQASPEGRHIHPQLKKCKIVSEALEQLLKAANASLIELKMKA